MLQLSLEFHFNIYIIFHLFKKKKISYHKVKKKCVKKKNCDMHAVTTEGTAVTERTRTT